MWSRFEEGFLELWRKEELHKGQAYLRGMYPDATGLEKAQQGYMARLWQVMELFRKRSRVGDWGRTDLISRGSAGEVRRVRYRFLTRCNLEVPPRAVGPQPP